MIQNKIDVFFFKKIHRSLIIKFEKVSILLFATRTQKWALEFDSD